MDKDKRFGVIIIFVDWGIFNFTFNVDWIWTTYLTMKILNTLIIHRHCIWIVYYGFKFIKWSTILKRTILVSFRGMC